MQKHMVEESEESLVHDTISLKFLNVFLNGFLSYVQKVEK